MRDVRAKRWREQVPSSFGIKESRRPGRGRTALAVNGPWACRLLLLLLGCVNCKILRTFNIFRTVRDLVKITSRREAL